MILGGVKFKAGKLAYDELEERFLYKWHTIERAKDSPVMQFQAEHKKSVTLSGTLSAIESGLNAFDELKAKAARGEPMTLNL
jgi:phage protein U